MNSMYLSLPIVDTDTHAYIQTNNLLEKYTIEDLHSEEASSKRVAELLANFEIIGVARGQGEW